MSDITIIGLGATGTALAKTLLGAGLREQQVAALFKLMEARNG